MKSRAARKTARCSVWVEVTIVGIWVCDRRIISSLVRKDTGIRPTGSVARATDVKGEIRGIVERDRVIFTDRIASAKWIMTHESVKVRGLASTKADRIGLQEFTQTGVINSLAIIIHARRG